MCLQQDSLALVKRFYHAYLVEHNFALVREVLSKNITWFGSNEQTARCSYDDVLRLLREEQASTVAPFVLTDYHADACELDAQNCLVFGELRVTHPDDPAAMDYRFSVVCRREAEGLRLVHCHFPAPSPNWKQGDFSPYGDSQEYSRNLEEQLQKRTRALQEKTVAMETLVANMTGGVRTFLLDEQQSITYINDSLLRLCGYTREQLQAELSDSYLPLIDPTHHNSVKQTLQNQLIDSNNFELEYPLLRRDGGRLWVLEKGTLFRNAWGVLQAQSVITDITSQKQLENDLRQQNEALTLHKQQLFVANITRNSVTYTDLRAAQELDLPTFSTYTNLVDYLCRVLTHQSDRERLAQFFATQECMAAIAKGDVQRTGRFQLQHDGNRYLWVQVDLICIQNELTGDITMRCYLKNINEEKLRSDRMADEHRLYELMISHTATAYEINLSRDAWVKGHEEWASSLGLAPTTSYHELIETFANKMVYSADLAAFLQTFRLSSVLQRYAEGHTDLYCEYRRRDPDGQYLWVSYTLHVFEELQSGELHAFGYVQDIHERKLKQLDLIYRAEHDQLTGLLNKTKVEQLTDEFLAIEGKNGQHAFFIFDIDNFKSINDQLGHAFGDVVLSRAAGKVRELFRDYDLLGRVGGDEFVVMMKNVHSVRIIESKARELCEQLHDIYAQDGVSVTVSVSVGIAFYPQHGSSYLELYTRSDIALYASKEGGRSRWMVYSDTLTAAPARTTQPDEDELTEVRSFESNITEFVFRILYETPDKKTAIGSVLALVGKQYHVSRAYIFEEDVCGTAISNTFEWCAPGIATQRQRHQHTSYHQMDDYPLNFNEAGIFYLPELDAAKASLRKLLAPQEIVSMLQFSILRNDSFYGFVGYDFCDRAVVPAKGDITVLKMVANMLGVFLTERRSVEIAVRMSDVALTIIDALDSYTYIIDPDTYRLRLINKKTRSLAPNVITGDRCYRAFQDCDTPCKDCPMKLLTDEHDACASVNMRNNFLKKHTRATASWVDWTDGTRACLLHCVEIPFEQADC